MENNANVQTQNQQTTTQNGGTPTKFCKNCGGKIAEKAIICPLCGCQVEEMKTTNAAPQPQQIVINNSNSNVNQNNIGTVGGRMKNKWVAFWLCFFLGYLGAHRFYEGKVGSGILYLLTFGVFGIGWLIDTIILLCKPNPYYV
ncbi:MAG: TM2 domain-containing protein [Ruminococcaceae bacterium]|nr:TM2 domain-containing protein [Oscillospiraceae bacterium]